MRQTDAQQRRAQREQDARDANALSQEIWDEWQRRPGLEETGLTFTDAMIQASERLGFLMSDGREPILNGPDGRRLRAVWSASHGTFVEFV